MQLKTCTNPDRIMKHRHKILHSMEIAFSHVLWLEKKRETDSERQMETHGARRKRGGKKKREMQRESPSSLLECHRGEERSHGVRDTGFSSPLASPHLGPKEIRRAPPPIWGLGIFFPYIFLYIFSKSRFLKN